MRALADIQRTFTHALLQPVLRVPDAVGERAGTSRERRFRVYRNNVKASLVAALTARFPVVRRLVGDEFFEAMALVFIGQHPPLSPVLAEYGAGFARFLEGFEPAADLPYLPDVARLEWARHAAYHAADAAPIGIDRLAALAPEDLHDARLVLHPAAALVDSPWPIVSIWTTNSVDEEVRPIGPDHGAETALVTRPRHDVLIHRLPAGAGVAIASLQAGRPLGEAIAGAPADFDLPHMLAVLFGAGAITGLLKGAPE
ncbi:putative DNA-binding domain-containing protein [Reyranella aquatilis]|uniref:DNA-binding domain-containing protein n=1 Tax=Reyranella aquatilis TaxID=2035356 RepID=A0ABS8KUI9_9HYPH|nr:DNA-binding domain-containing protein [Reyranella aquatilis]MCC8429745.1 putative DNA-binding domain-containing protein [Reyranella aquatilis]